MVSIIHNALMDINTVLLAAAYAPPPLDPTNLLNDIFTWLVRILGGVGAVFFVIELFKHLATSPRDLRAAGIDGLTMAILIAVAAKADVLVKWAQSAL